MEKETEIKVIHNQACVLQNQYLRVEFDDQGNLKNITNRDKNLTLTFSTQGFYWYQSK